jgi:hypothetical protein
LGVEVGSRTLGSFSSALKLCCTHILCMALDNPNPIVKLKSERIKNHEKPSNELTDEIQPEEIFGKNCQKKTNFKYRMLKYNENKHVCIY